LERHARRSPAEPKQTERTEVDYEDEADHAEPPCKERCRQDTRGQGKQGRTGYDIA